MSACDNLGAIYSLGKGGEKDYAKANALFEKACNSGNMSACDNLGAIYSLGKGGEKDYAKAKELLGKACDGGNMNGCANLGVLYEKGQGVKQDVEKARELFTKACDGDSMNGCLNLGVIYHKGQGVKQDFEKARDLYTKACDSGFTGGCKYLGVITPTKKYTKRFEIEVLKVVYMTGVSTKNGLFRVKASEGGMFIGVVWSYKNISKKPIESGISSKMPRLSLVSPDGIEYSKDTDATSTFAIQVGVNRKIISNLNPMIKVKDATVFEVSTELYKESGWKIRIKADKKTFDIRIN
jgi:hypothetical protein